MTKRKSIGVLLLALAACNGLCAGSVQAQDRIGVIASSLESAGAKVVTPGPT